VYQEKLQSLKFNNRSTTKTKCWPMQTVWHANSQNTDKTENPINQKFIQNKYAINETRSLLRNNSICPSPLTPLNHWAIIIIFWSGWLILI